MLFIERRTPRSDKGDQGANIRYRQSGGPFAVV